MDKEKLRTELYDKQYNSKYDESKFIIFNMEYGGFGAMLARRKLALQFGLYFNRIVLLNYTNYLYDEPFKNISNFNLNDIKNEGIKIFNYDLNQKDKVVFFNFNNYWNNSLIKNTFHEKSLYNLDFKDFSGLLLNFFQLKENYQKLLNDKLKKLNLKDRTIGIHIRRGDKELETPYIPMYIFIEELNKVKEKTGINNVYICSDSTNAIYELMNSLKEFNITYDTAEIRHEDKIWHPPGPSNKESETFIGIKNIEILTNCDYIIGQSNVQFAKISVCKSIDKKNKLDVFSLINPLDLKKVAWDIRT